MRDGPDWPTRPAWMEDPRRGCRGMNALFFVPGAEGGGTTREGYEALARAREICRSCPFVDGECLDYALTAGSGGGPVKDGIWAGRTVMEIRAIARERRLVTV